MIWNENAECMEREEKEELQLALATCPIPTTSKKSL